MYYDYEGKVLETLAVVKTFIQTTNTKGYYSFDGAKPIMVFEFNLFKQGLFNKRIAYSIIDVFQELGAL